MHPSMKTLSLSFVLILTCLSALAGEQDDFYLGDANCRIFNPSPRNDEKISWSGACKDGYADGRGVLQWYQQEKPGSRYEGTMEKGRPHGSGVYSYTSNARYVGEFKNGKRHGKGVLTSPDGTTLTATFVDGEAVGDVERSSLSGYRYKGGWKNGKPEGKGLVKYTDGALYEGDFKEGDGRSAVHR